MQLRDHGVTDRVLFWLLRRDRTRSTPSCGKHCIRYCGMTVMEVMVRLPGEFHCPCRACHGKEDVGFA